MKIYIKPGLSELSTSSRSKWEVLVCHNFRFSFD